MRRLTRLLTLWRDLPRLRHSALFLPDWYAQTYPDIGHYDPARHYLAHGAAEGRDPGPGFSTSGYGLQGAFTGNPLLDYETRGKAAGRMALPSFAGQGRDGPARVLFAAHQAPTRAFGAERSLLDMLDRAATAGLTAEVLAPQMLSSDYLAQLQTRAARVHVLPYGWRRAGVQSHPGTLAALITLIRRSGAVELHQNTLAVEAPLIAARAAGVPTTLWLREIPDQDPELCARLGQDPDTLRMRLLEQADRFIANSTETARWIDPDGSLGMRLETVPNMVDQGLFDLEFAPPARPRIGLTGSLTAKKGIADFIAVARAFAALGGQAEFVLIGPSGPDLAALSPLPRRVSHTGYAASPVQAMAQIDLLLSLSHFAESFGRTVLEAMAAGRPVICYDRGAPPRLLGAGGRVCPPDDPPAVARALRALLADPAGLHACSAAARSRAHDLLRAAANSPPQRIFPHAISVASSTELP